MVTILVKCGFLYDVQQVAILHMLGRTLIMCPSYIRLS